MRKHVNLQRDVLDYVRKHEKLHTRTAQKNIVYYKGAREPLTQSLNVRVNAKTSIAIRARESLHKSLKLFVDNLQYYSITGNYGFNNHVYHRD